jgi:CopG family transcriptional regulator/antitoxin EndoAI
MHNRINITLPRETLDLLDQFVQKGDRSRFIHEAIQRYIQELQREALRQQLKEGAIQRAERDRGLAEDWYRLEEEAWQHSANS